MLLLQALAECCIARGLLSREEIAAMAEQIDLTDGLADGKLDPQTLRPAPPQPSPPISPEEHLRRLEEEG